VIGLATISFILLLTVVYLIARPFLPPQIEASGVRTEVLLQERDRVAAQLHDLDMEYSTGKLAETDYRAQRARREADLAAAEEELGALTGPVATATIPFGDEDDELERMIADRRAQLAGHACPSCGTAIDQDDHFCRVCGTHLSEVNT
jgi:DNA repair exonuclease SbcCD ATPase subunit